jgi:hypothetical protein
MIFIVIVFALLVHYNEFSLTDTKAHRAPQFLHS